MNFVGMEMLVLLGACVCSVCVCVYVCARVRLSVHPPPCGEQNIPLSVVIDHLTPGNNVRSHLIFTFERWPYK